MRRRTMKYVCFGYYDKGKFDGMTEAERNAMFDTCFDYDDHLRANGHWAGGEALQPAETALTVYWKNGKVATTDGPYAETKEQIGGIGVLEARDMNHAIQLIGQHPALKYGTIWEIRPAGDMNEIMKASEQRRGKKNTPPPRKKSNQLTRRDFAMRAAGFGLTLGLTPAPALAEPQQASRSENSPAVADPYSLVDPELLPALKQFPAFDFSAEMVGKFRQTPGLPPLPAPAPQPAERHIPGPTGAPEVRLWIVDPAPSERRKPVLLFIHGGGL